MEFIKHNFKVGDRVTVDQLNEIEDGIIEAAQSGGSAEEAIETILDGASEITTFAAVEDNFTEVNNGLNALQLNLNSLAKAAMDSDGNLQTQININKDSINVLFEELGMTIGSDTEFPGAEGTSKISEIETNLGQVNDNLEFITQELSTLETKTGINELLLDDILEDLGLNGLVDTEFPNEEDRISTRVLAQYSNDTVNILVQELGLNDAIFEEYPTQNTRSIRELIDSKLELIKLDIDDSYDQETIKQIYEAITTNDTTIRLLVNQYHRGYRYLDVISLTQEIEEGREKYIGKTIDNDYQVIIEIVWGESSVEYSIEFTRPATTA